MTQMAKIDKLTKQFNRLNLLARELVKDVAGEQYTKAEIEQAYLAVYDEVKLGVFDWVTNGDFIDRMAKAIIDKLDGNSQEAKPKPEVSQPKLVKSAK